VNLEQGIGRFWKWLIGRKLMKEGEKKVKKLKKKGKKGLTRGGKKVILGFL